MMLHDVELHSSCETLLSFWAQNVIYYRHIRCRPFLFSLLIQFQWGRFQSMGTDEQMVIEAYPLSPIHLAVCNDNCLLCVKILCDLFGSFCHPRRFSFTGFVQFHYLAVRHDSCSFFLRDLTICLPFKKKKNNKMTKKKRPHCLLEILLWDSLDDVIVDGDALTASSRVKRT